MSNHQPDMNNKKPGIHPLVGVACVAVVIACLVGVANMAGWIGNKDKAEVAEVSVNDTKVAVVIPESEKTVIVQPKPIVVEKPKPVVKPVVTPPKPNYRDEDHRNDRRDDRYDDRRDNNGRNDNRTNRQVCQSCGVIDSIQAVENRGAGSGLGAIGGALAGGLLGNQVGGGNGKTAATIAGAVGGGYVGNRLEGNMKKTQTYKVKVRFQDDTYQTFDFREPTFNVGQRVRLNGSNLEAY